MTRVHILLAALAGILVVVLFWLLLWSPQQEELEALNTETESLEDQQRLAASRIAALEAVRDEAPQQEALLVAANTVIPQEAALPAFLRQLQQATDEAGLTLQAVTPSRPSPVDDTEGSGGLHAINVSVDLEGSYFQLVDFLRRIEDPSITPRAMIWNSMSVGGDAESHPVLNIALQGDVYAVLPTPPAEGPEPDDEDEEDADIEVEVEE